MIELQQNDILFGRGPACYNRPGNKIFRKVIRSYTFLYCHHASAAMKRACIDKVWEELTTVGCRFLLRAFGGDHCLCLASDDIAKKKISHALRDSRKQMIDKVYERLNLRHLKSSPKQDANIISDIYFHENLVSQCNLQNNQVQCYGFCKDDCLRSLNNSSPSLLANFIDIFEVEKFNGIQHMNNNCVTSDGKNRDEYEFEGKEFYKQENSQKDSISYEYEGKK
jgi:hypothetical protein